jgi:enamine deaminase RidA (YjgF/YER057c/UK114 family)
VSWIGAHAAKGEKRSLPDRWTAISVNRLTDFDFEVKAIARIPG